MSYDLFRARMNIRGNNANVLKNSTIHKINASFADSPYYKVIQIDGIDTETRIVQQDTKKANLKMLLLKPDNTSVKGGSIAFIDSVQWLVTEFFDEEPFKKAKISECNYSIDVNGNSYPCVVNHILFAMDVQQIISVPNGTALLSVQANTDTEQIALGDLFMIGGVRYKVKGIDKLTYKGIISLTLDVTTNPAPINNDIPNNGGGTGW